MMTNRRGIVLFSGGIDSTLATLILANEHTDLIGLSINYPGRPRGEVEAAKTLSCQLPLLKLIEISIDLSTVIPSGGSVMNDMEGWIPYRNLLFWSLAAHKAKVLDLNFVAAGHHRTDGGTYNDATIHFFEILQSILNYSGNAGHNSIQVELPLLWTSDEKIDEYAIANKRVLSNSWSCWRDRSSPCMTCFACDERRAYLESLSTLALGGRT
jgi:queuosine biosynthesis protein QueC